MNKSLRSLLGLLLLVGAPTTCLVGCGGQDLDGGSRVAFFIRSTLAPPSNRANGSCSYIADTPALFQGTLDVGVRDNYFMTVAAKPTDATAPINVSGVEVSVKRLDGTLLRSFSQVTTGFLDRDKEGVLGFIGLDAPTAQILRDELKSQADDTVVNVRTLSLTVSAEVVLTGTDLVNNTAVKSPIYKFPIAVCVGCLVSFPAGVNDSSKDPRMNCFGDVPPPAVQPCFSGQDEGISCRLCNGRPTCDFF